MRNPNFRRQQVERTKARAQRQLRLIWWKEPEGITAKAVAKRAAHRTTCSCPRCGNPRRFLGEITRQEMQADCRLADENSSQSR